MGSSEKGDFGHFLILSYVLMQKRLTIKAFVEVTLVLLTLSARTVVKNFWKNADSFAVLTWYTAAN